MLKPEEPSLLLSQPPQLEIQVLTSDLTTPFVHLGDSNAGPRMGSLEKAVVLITKSPTCLDYSHVGFNEGNLGESNHLESLHKQGEVLGQRHPMLLLRYNRKLEFLVTQAATGYFPTAPNMRSLDYC